MLARVLLGKVGGQDGVWGEFVRALDPAHQGVLWDRITGVLLGKEEVPDAWRKATVILIPKIPRPLRAADYRPITVLPVLAKVTLKLWLREAQPHIELRPPASHGFRSGWQAAELIHLIRTIGERREDWQLPFMLAKPDI